MKHFTLSKSTRAAVIRNPGRLPVRTTDRITPQRLRKLDADIEAVYRRSEQTLAEIKQLVRK